MYPNILQWFCISEPFWTGTIFLCWRAPNEFVCQKFLPFPSFWHPQYLTDILFVLSLPLSSFLWQPVSHKGLRRVSWVSSLRTTAWLHVVILYCDFTYLCQVSPRQSSFQGWIIFHLSISRAFVKQDRNRPLRIINMTNSTEIRLKTGLNLKLSNSSGL